MNRRYPGTGKYTSNLAVMKKFFGFCLVVMLTLIVGILVWLQLPRVESPKLVADSKREVEGRFALLQSHARDASKNIFIDSKFQGFWSNSAALSPELEQAVDNWTKECQRDSASGFVEALKRPEFVAAERDFTMRTEGLAKCLSKPFFVVPSASPKFLPNKIEHNKLDKMETALGYRLEFLAFQGRWDEMAVLTEAVLHFGRAGDANAAIGCGALGRAHGVVLEALAKVVQPSSNLSANQWADLSISILHELPSDKQFYRVIQATLYQIDSEVEKEKLRVTRGLIHYLPGIWNRERRVRVNFFARILKSISDEGNLSKLVSRTNHGVSAFFAGTLPLPTSQVNYNYARDLEFQLEFVRTGLQGLGLSCGLLAYRAKHGRFPDKLEQIADVGIDLEQHVDWVTPVPTYKISQSGGVQLSLPLSTSFGNGPGLVSNWIDGANTLDFRLGEQKS